jgi:glutaredoxin 3
MITPTLYVKTGCPWCEEVLDYLDDKEIEYDKVVVSGDRDAMDEMVEVSGQSKAPTMDWDGDVLADFGVDELVPFLRKKGIDA